MHPALRKGPLFYKNTPPHFISSLRAWCYHQRGEYQKPRSVAVHPFWQFPFVCPAHRDITDPGLCDIGNDRPCCMHLCCVCHVMRPECQHLYSNDSFTYLFFFSEQTAELVSSCLYAGSENLLTIHLCHIIFRPYHVHRLWPIATDVAYSMVSVSAVGHVNGPCENDVCGQCLPDS